MADGNTIFVMGLGDDIFSEGMEEIAGIVQETTNWNAHVYTHRDLTHIKRAFNGMPGPMIFAGHSAGASTINNFAKKRQMVISTGIFVDAWFPFMRPAKAFDNVISLKASKWGRFHVRNADMKITIKATHTTIDNSKRFHDIVLSEIIRLNDENR